MPQSARFWNRIAGMYSRKPVDNEAAYEKKLQATREYLRPDSVVLEFGCGTGSTAIAHAPFIKHLTAIDISSKMLEIARDKVSQESVDNIDLKCGTIEAFAAPDRSFDVIMGHSILHLVDSRDVVCQKAYNLLKPGGVFITSTPCLSEIAPLVRFVAPVGSLLGLMPMVKLFTLKELLSSLTRAGFEIDHQWQPSEKEAVFIVARKSGEVVK